LAMPVTRAFLPRRSRSMGAGQGLGIGGFSRSVEPNGSAMESAGGPLAP
jgi:hypothetical protein